MLSDHTQDSLLHGLWHSLHEWREREPHRVFHPDALENWDPKAIRATLPAFKFLRDRYYRGKVFGLRKLPEGPFMLVGAHGGGPMNVFADNMVLFTSYYETTRIKRPLYVAADHIVFHLGPIGHMLAKYGAIDGTRANALAALRAGNGFAVFPGGVDDMARTFLERNTVDFHGRTGFVKIALETGVPIYPVGQVGGHEVEIVLSHGYKIAAALRLKKLVGLKSFPIALTIPWGLTVGYLPYIPLPAQILMRVGDPMVFRPSEKEKNDPQYQAHVRDEVQKEVQRLTDELVVYRREHKPDKGERNQRKSVRESLRVVRDRS